MAEHLAEAVLRAADTDLSTALAFMAVVVVLWAVWLPCWWLLRRDHDRRDDAAAGRELAERLTPPASSPSLLNVPAADLIPYAEWTSAPSHRADPVWYFSSHQGAHRASARRPHRTGAYCERTLELPPAEVWEVSA